MYTFIPTLIQFVLNTWPLKCCFLVWLLLGHVIARREAKTDMIRLLIFPLDQCAFDVCFPSDNTNISAAPSAATPLEIVFNALPWFHYSQGSVVWRVVAVDLQASFQSGD